DQRPGLDELAPRRLAEPVQHVGRVVEPPEAGVLEAGRERVSVGRHRHDRDLREAASRPGDRRPDVGGAGAWGGAARAPGDPIAVQLVVDERRVGALPERLLAVELAAELVNAVARALKIALEALLESLRGPVHDLVAEPDADQDPDREREEHGGKRRYVVAR